MSTVSQKVNQALILQKAQWKTSGAFSSSHCGIFYNVIHTEKPLSDRCHMSAQWTIKVVCLHALYVAILVGVTGVVRHIEFRFDELKDLWRLILVSALAIAVWVTAYILDEIHDDISWLQVASIFLLLVVASILVLVFFSISNSQPLLSQISLRRRESRESRSICQALGIPDSGVLAMSEPTSRIDRNERLDKLLLNKRFSKRMSLGATVRFLLSCQEVTGSNPVNRLFACGGKTAYIYPPQLMYAALPLAKAFSLRSLPMVANGTILQG